MLIHSRLRWRLARWRIRSCAAYAAKYINTTGRKPEGRHEVPLLGLGGFVVTIQHFDCKNRNPASEPVAKAHGNYDVRLIRAYRAGMGHYLANEADKPAPEQRK